jgi:hypothetical protein
MAPEISTIFEHETSSQLLPALFLIDSSGPQTIQVCLFFKNPSEADGFLVSVQGIHVGPAIGTLSKLEILNGQTFETLEKR